MKVRYALIVESTAAFSQGGQRVTELGDKFWVCTEAEGWVDATSSHCNDENDIPEDAKTFATEAAAVVFANKWPGHPWWCKPFAYKVIAVLPKYEQVQRGWGRTSRQ